ncbi:DUF3304 domain-containing protein [Pseudothauera lacus]|uniref:DUF3304 domain-containing protein n=1 Tax=Pseudothauera lacus TaxID=2136175 RepID=A0A2T4IFJ7_9RHOO|nr:DUF3304 domain-containing protein [Pseudothauera lacus]PTD96559.1 hypothetical protein C8261_09695 [Pseudothauera lacus]
MNQTPARHRNGLLPALAVTVALAAVMAYGSYRWELRDSPEPDQLISGTLSLINYTDESVYSSVRNSKYPNPGQGASYDVGPRAGGGGVMCCVPIPARWRPGIKMNVSYRFGNWEKGREVLEVVELPVYPDGVGHLYLIFHSEYEFELLSTSYEPGHPRWPGRKVEPTVDWLE